MVFIVAKVQKLNERKTRWNEMVMFEGDLLDGRKIKVWVHGY